VVSEPHDGTGAYLGREVVGPSGDLDAELRIRAIACHGREACPGSDVGVEPHVRVDLSQLVGEV
jgi:hypothetical protein